MISTSFPKAYQKRWVKFYGLKFLVNPDVLIPRVESEQLVDEVCDFVKSRPNLQPSIADVGTGSGCLAISLALKLPKATITAIDVSPKALKIAKLNARYHQVDGRINFLKNDLLDKFYLENKIVVANLPYIPSSRIPNLDVSVKNFEPHLAIDGGSDGFAVYRKLFAQIRDNNIIPELMVIEIDDDQGKIAQEEVKRFFPKAVIEIKKDFALQDRICVVKAS